MPQSTARLLEEPETLAAMQLPLLTVFWSSFPLSPQKHVNPGSLIDCTQQSNALYPKPDFRGALHSSSPHPVHVLSPRPPGGTPGSGRGETHRSKGAGHGEVAAARGGGSTRKKPPGHAFSSPGLWMFRRAEARRGAPLLDGSKGRGDAPLPSDCRAPGLVGSSLRRGAVPWRVAGVPPVTPSKSLQSLPGSQEPSQRLLAEPLSLSTPQPPSTGREAPESQKKT